jgi:DNA-binding NarL/FixJ family response regulator
MAREWSTVLSWTYTMREQPSVASSETATARVVVVDDHVILRAALCRLLREHGMDVVGDAPVSRDACTVAEVSRPDIVVVAIDGAQTDVLSLIATMRSHAQTPRILVQSIYDDAAHLRLAFAAGVDGYLHNRATEQELIDAMDALARGERYVHPRLGARLLQSSHAPDTVALSDRELEIARLLALGHTNQEIALLMHLSVRTIESHRSHLMSKLRIRTRSALVAWALAEQLIGSPTLARS